MIESVVSKEEVRQAVAEACREGKTVGFVPTMGALHDGHRSLMQAARKRTGFVVVSIFVNPTQFGPTEDFAAYPRDLARDVELLSAEGVDLVFTPSTEEMYGSDVAATAAAADTGAGAAATAGGEAGVTVDPGPLAERWEGAIRPGHFRGMATVVAKLLNIVRPSLAFFGEKDFQQLVIVRRMVADLDLPGTIVGRPVVRERDGLALSSRNVRLSPSERKSALALSRALEAAASTLAWGERSGEALEGAMHEVFAAEPGAELDYAAVVDPDTLEPVASVTSPARAIVAARVGAVRLIDNCELVPPHPNESA